MKTSAQTMKYILVALTTLLLTISMTVFAAPFAPGETLDPGCDPYALDCYVDIGGNNIYTTDGVLTGNRTVDLDTFKLDFANGDLQLSNYPEARNDTTGTTTYTLGSTACTKDFNLAGGGSFSGTYTGGASSGYAIDIESGDATFSWSENGVTQATGIPIAASTFSLSNGVSFTFNNPAPYPFKNGCAATIDTTSSGIIPQNFLFTDNAGNLLSAPTSSLGGGGGSDTLSTLSCSINQIAKWDGSSWVCDNQGGIELWAENTTGAFTPLIATGNGSVAMGGYPAQATGNYSLAWGNHTSLVDDGAQGEQSVSFGDHSGSLGNASYSFGYGAKALGSFSYSIGTNTYARSIYETVLGVNPTDYSIFTPDSQASVNPQNRLFNIGNGISSGTTSDAFTILKNAQTGIDIDNFEANTDGNKLQVNGSITAMLPAYATTAAAAADAALTTGMFFKVTNGDGTSSVHVKD